MRVASVHLSILGLRLLLFFLVFGGLHSGWESLRGSVIEYGVIHHGTVRPSTWLINALTPDVQAAAVDFSVRARGGGLNVLNGCEGLEALFLLCAALVAAQASVPQRLIGLLLGVPLIFVLNQARIVSLFYAARTHPSLFDALHAVVAPIVIVIGVCAYFYAWLIASQPEPAKAG